MKNTKSKETDTDPPIDDYDDSWFLDLLLQAIQDVREFERQESEAADQAIKNNDSDK